MKRTVQMILTPLMPFVGLGLLLIALVVVIILFSYVFMIVALITLFLFALFKFRSYKIRKRSVWYSCSDKDNTKVSATRGRTYDQDDY